MIEAIKRILNRIRAGKIQQKIASGKVVHFESPLEEMAFKYIPGVFGKPGKYYAKFYTQDEFEIGSDSTSVVMGVMEGRQISKERYDHFHLIPGVVWNRKANNSEKIQIDRKLVQG